MSLASLVNKHTTLTADLAQRLRELGDTRAHIARNQGQLWHSTAHLSVTERREEVRHSTYTLVAEVETQLGEVDALRAELTNIELQIAHHGNS